ncbi:MAG: hypothetical protein U0531_06705 [Dehalococcoidia bacterium]
MRFDAVIRGGKVAMVKVGIAGHDSGSAVHEGQPHRHRRATMISNNR